jgi:hypothetical protein
MIKHRDTGWEMGAGIPALLFSLALCPPVKATDPDHFDSGTPPAFTQKTESFDYVRRTAMIPMRDDFGRYLSRTIF